MYPSGETTTHLDDACTQSARGVRMWRVFVIVWIQASVKWKHDLYHQLPTFKTGLRILKILISLDWLLTLIISVLYFDVTTLFSMLSFAEIRMNRKVPKRKSDLDCLQQWKTLAQWIKKKKKKIYSMYFSSAF